MKYVGIFFDVTRTVKIAWHIKILRKKLKQLTRSVDGQKTHF